MSYQKASVFDSFEKVASPTTAGDPDVMKVEINPGSLLRKLTGNYSQWLYLKDPLRFERVNLNEDELWDYTLYCLALESRDVVGKGYPKEARLLYLPPYLQELMHFVGNAAFRGGAKRVELVEFKPQVEDEKAFDISAKVGSFEGVVPVLRNAVPPRDSVNPDVMSCVVKSGSVYSLVEGQHPKFAFIAGLLGLKLVDEDRYGVVFDQLCDSLVYMESYLGGTYGIFS